MKAMAAAGHKPYQSGHQPARADQRSAAAGSSSGTKNQQQYKDSVLSQVGTTLKKAV